MQIGGMKLGGAEANGAQGNDKANGQQQFAANSPEKQFPEGAQQAQELFGKIQGA